MPNWNRWWRIPRITYEDAIALLQRRGNPAKLGDDFGGDEETILSNGQFDRPVIVHRYPAALKAFYMQTDPARTDLALCMDVLAPEGYGEIIGGGQRIHEYDKLLARLHEHHLPLEAFQWYLDLRQVRFRSSCGIRHGNRTGGGVDLRP
ncbi:MAG: amino acid--tRNA ligase-related protein [Nitrospiraceae bacterium]